MRMYIAGGLGNQMFEYAFARHLNLKYGYKIIFDFSELMYHSYEGRKYGLDNLNVNTDFFTIKSNKICFAYFKTVKKMLLKKVDSITDEVYARFNRLGLVVSLGSYKYYKFNFDYKIHFFYGNFQSWKYFDDNREIIKNELRVRTEPNQENANLIRKISLENSVCVHVRRGDYCNPEWESLCICNYEYYRKGMEYIASIVEDAVFYVFSNTHEDIEWIKKNYDFSMYQVEYIDLNNEDYEELRLMYTCKHFVISNSTFSWWAQYLSQNNDKIVVAPSVWNKMEDATDIYEDYWHLIQC